MLDGIPESLPSLYAVTLASFFFHQSDQRECCTMPICFSTRFDTKGVVGCQKIYAPMENRGIVKSAQLALSQGFLGEISGRSSDSIAHSEIVIYFLSLPSPPEAISKFATHNIFYISSSHSLHLFFRTIFPETASVSLSLWRSAKLIKLRRERRKWRATAPPKGERRCFHIQISAELRDG